MAPYKLKEFVALPVKSVAHSSFELLLLISKTKSTGFITFIAKFEDRLISDRYSDEIVIYAQL
jgi:hypothetical protein